MTALLFNRTRDVAQAIFGDLAHAKLAKVSLILFFFFFPLLNEEVRTP